MTEALAAVNPPAFPTDPMTQGNGMTLRDYFAAAALQGIAANPELERRRDASYGDVAEWAYAQADAMLAERAKGGR